MRRLSFVEDHDWGGYLSDTDYAQAIAAVGLMIPAPGSPDFLKDPDIFPKWAFDLWMATEAPLPWGSPFRSDWKMLLKTISPTDAQQLWAAFTDEVREVRRAKSDLPRPLRLHFERRSLVSWKDLRDDYMQLLQLFATPGVAVDSFSLPWWDKRKRRRQKNWHWPLRVGSLPTVAGEALLERIKTNPAWYYDQLLSFVDPFGSDETCDLLLVPYESLESKTRGPQELLRSSAVLVFGAEGHEKLDINSISRFADTVEASAVVILPDTGLPEKQAQQLFEALTHDEPLDAAASNAASVRDGLPGPMVFSDRDFLARTRLSTVAWQHARRHARGGDLLTADRMLSEVSASWFGAESAGASDIARAMKETSGDVKEKPRYLQANVWAPKTGKAHSEWSGAQAFRMGVWHGVETYIAELAKDAKSELEPFPDLELPENQLENELRVALTAPNCVVTTHSLFEENHRGGPEVYQEVASRFFPDYASEKYLSEDMTDTLSAATCIMRLPEEGASSFGGFLLMPLTSDPVEARISVLHENRVLQTALLRGPVVGRTDDTSESKQGIRLSPEGIVRASLEELDERRRFNAAFIFNHASGGASHVTVVKDGDIKIREVGGDISATTEIGDVLVDSTNNPDAFKSIKSAAVRRLLVSLALKGVKIRDHFVIDSGFSDSADRPIKRIQILSARPEAGAPLEFVYEGYAPDDDAKLCPNHKNAMDNGDCGDCPHKRGAEYVCAMRFWGMSKVIERHKYQAGLPNGDFVRINEAVGLRNAIPRPNRALVAWSKNAEDFTGGSEALKDLQSTLKAVAKHASTVRTWKKWRDEAKRDPSLLLMLTHTDWQGGDAVLEIAESEGLVDGRIDDRIVGKAEPARIVVILGCSTADRQRKYTSMPGRFRHAGANIVLATLTDILGRHAAPAANELLIGLDECWNTKSKERALGDVITRMRRRLLSKGLPIGMALIAYGDADWRLE